MTLWWWRKISSGVMTNSAPSCHPVFIFFQYQCYTSMFLFLIQVMSPSPDWTVLPPSLSFHWGYRVRACWPAHGRSPEVHRRGVGISGILHPVQGPPQKPRPNRYHRGGGQALGDRLGEDDHQHEQAQSTTEDWTVSLVVLPHLPNYVAYCWLIRPRFFWNFFRNLWYWTCAVLALHQCISWIFNCLRKADINCDQMMSPEEVKRFLQNINVEVDDEYVKVLFEVLKKKKNI